MRGGIQFDNIPVSIRLVAKTLNWYEDCLNEIDEENITLQAQLAQILQLIWNHIAEIHNDPELEFDCKTCVLTTICKTDEFCKIYEPDDCIDKIKEVLGSE